MLVALTSGCVLRLLLSQSVIHVVFSGKEQLDWGASEENMLNACQVIVAVASVMQSFKLLQLAYVRRAASAPGPDPTPNLGPEPELEPQPEPSASAWPGISPGGAPPRPADLGDDRDGARDLGGAHHLRAAHGGY